MLQATILAAVALGLAGCGSQRQTVRTDTPSAERPRQGWESDGIRVHRITHAIAGQMLDLRFSVTDMAKAERVLKETTPISLIDQASGVTLAVPNMGKVGRLRSVPKTNDPHRYYWMFFNNTGNLIKAGSRVTLAVGDVRIRDIVVE